jgi:hypothetical protein
VKFLNAEKKTDAEPISLRGEHTLDRHGKVVTVEIALQWTDSLYEAIQAYTNNVHQPRRRHAPPASRRPSQVHQRVRQEKESPQET